MLWPIKVKSVGTSLTPLYDAWKPKLTDPPSGTVPFHVSLSTTTCWPVCVYTALHKLTICWLPGKVQVSVQLFKSLPVLLVMVSGSTRKPSTVGDGANLLKENENVGVLMALEKPIGVELPNFVILRVVQTDPGFKGDTANGAVKPATVETGATVNVPLFVNQDDLLRIDTRTGDYVERA